MTARPLSLKRRLIRTLILSQLAAVLLWAGTLFTAAWLIQPPDDRDFMGAARVITLVEPAIIAGPDGRPILQPTPALAAYLARKPTLHILVEEQGTGRILPGSSPLLAQVVGPSPLRFFGEGTLRVTDPQFAGETGYYRPVETEFGPMAVLFVGNRLQWDDVWPDLLFLIYQLPIVFGPFIPVAAFVAFLVVRRGLRPLDQVVETAAKLDLGSLNQRLPEAEVPSELQPLIQAMNSALARVDEGVARQRLFVANAAHELRTPVAILRARLEAARPGPETVALKRDVRRITTLVEQLLAIARLGEMPAQRVGRQDLVALVRNLVADYAPLVTESGRRIQFQAARPTYLVSGDARALESAVGNLVDNALREEPPGGEIWVTVGPDGTVAVADHGRGLPPEDRDRAFEPFWRGQTEGPGAGLGLAIVREVARLHGGTVQIGDTPGGGATVRLSLPAASDREPDHTAPAAAQSPHPREAHPKEPQPKEPPQPREPRPVMSG